MMPSDLRFARQVQQHYSDGYSFHGSLDLSVEGYRVHLASIVEKHAGKGTSAEAACSFLDTLSTTDLYLSAACAGAKERAWERFLSSYARLILTAARLAGPNQARAAEVADQVLVNLFLPDSSGRSRIASYDGRCSLAAWLRITVTNQASKEIQRKCNNLESIECLDRMADATEIARLERSLRASRNGPHAAQVLKLAAESLTACERNILLLRYEEELRLGQIAAALRCSPSVVCRRIQAIQQKLRVQIVAALTRKGLPDAAIEECVKEIVENGAYSILALLKRT